MKLRSATAGELALLQHLIGKAAGVLLQENWKGTLMVAPMDDGGMGSLLLFPEGPSEEHRGFGRQASEQEFLDSDGISVLASLNLDAEGRLFELDIWKVDYSPVRALPNSWP